jgi:hypothetical protein
MSLRRFVPFVLALAGAAAAADAQVRIAEVYGGGAGATGPYKQDYVILYNAGVGAQSLTGWSIQYASTTGAYTGICNINGAVSIAGKSYLLVQMSTSVTGIADIPAPDYISPASIAMSATGSKVALVSDQVVLTSACPPVGALVDLVGSASGSNCREGASSADNAPTPAATTSVQRVLGGCLDTDNNKRDFFVAAPTVRRAADGPAPTCPAAAELSLAGSSSAACPETIGNPVAIVLTATNFGYDTATNTVLTFKVPANIVIDSVVPSGMLSGDTYSVSLGTINAGNSQAVTFNVHATGGGQNHWIAKVSSDVADPVSFDNTADGVIFVTASGSSTDGLKARFSNVAANSNSAVPAAYTPNTARVFFTATTGQEIFGRPMLSPDGSKYVMRIRSDQATTVDEYFMTAPVDGSAAPTFVLQEGVTDIDPSGTVRLYTTTDLVPGVNNSGDVVTSGDTDAATTADEMVAKTVSGATSIVAAEAQSVDGVTIGTNQTSCGIDNNGRAYFAFVGNPVNTSDQRTVVEDGSGGFTRLAAEGATVPTGQVGGGSLAWSTFTNNISSHGSRNAAGDTLLVGTLTGTVDVVTLNDAVQVMDGSTVAGGTVTAINGAELRGSHVAIYGSNSNGDDWAMVDGVVVAKKGDPIFTGSYETWGDGAFAAGFFMFTCDESGNYVAGGLTNNSATTSDAVLVYNGTTLIAREGDPVDLDGNGSFDDDAYIRTFRDDRISLSNGVLAFVVEIRSAANSCGGAVKAADAVIFVTLAVPCPGDFNNSGNVDADDLFDFLDAWFASNPSMPMDMNWDARVDVDGNNQIDADDLFTFLDIWFATNPSTCP